MSFVIFLNDPVTHVSRARHYSTFNISETIQDRHTVNLLNYTWHTELCITIDLDLIVPLTLIDLQAHFSYLCMKMSATYFSSL